MPFLITVVSTAYENLEKHLQLAIRQLKEIREQKKKLDQEKLFDLEIQITDQITELFNATEEA